MRALVVLALFVAVVAGESWRPQRIVGGTTTNIASYPEISAMLYGPNTVSFSQWCGATIINTRALLTAAHCFQFSVNPIHYRLRVGSTFANSGGTVHATQRIIIHPSYNARTTDNDVAMMHTSTAIRYVNNAVQPATIAGANYFPADNSVVWAAGWGAISWGGPSSEQLRHVQIWIINQQVCRQRYATIGRAITDNMMCSGWLNVGGRDQCQGDSGGPLYHNRVVAGVCSWGHQCAHPNFPGVNARVSRFATWIRNNA